jgi:predicted dehydrogenase
VTHQPLGFGLVGAGAIAQAYAQVLRESPMASLVAVADIRPSAAQALAEASGCPAFESHETMLDTVECGAVVVCTPPNAHATIALEALRREIPVLCEKPLSSDRESARRMLRAAEEADVLLTMASKFRFVDDVIQAKSLVTSGVIGEVILFENAFTSYVNMSKRWNADPSISGGGVLIDNGTHSVDIVRYFLGPVAEVQAVEGKRTQGLAVEDTARIFIRTVDGVMANIDLSWSLNKGSATYIDVYGARGTVRVGWKESSYSRVGSSDWEVFGSGYQKLRAFRGQIENFCRAIRGQEPLLIDATDALASVEVIDAAYQSLKSDHWVRVAGADADQTPG